MITIGTKPDHDFDEPLGLMSDCHRRVEKFLDQLIIVADKVRGGELPAEASHALETALRYFQQAAPLHTADEEASLFPRLRALGVIPEDVLQAMARLERDHDVADAAHAAIDEAGLRWLQNGTLPREEAEHLLARLRELRAFYASHIALEDDYLFPLAARFLSSDEVETLGREMAARRGIDYDAPNRLGRCAARRANMAA